MRPILGEHVALLDVIGPLAAGQRLLVKSDVTNQIEGIEVLAEFVCDGVDREALGFQFLDNSLFAFGRFPALEEIVAADEALLQRRLGEVTQGFGDDLAVLVEKFDSLSEDACADTIDINR